MTAEALMQAILDAPDDDGPRLVYADWLEEHGDVERAEFIRVQCELAGLRPNDKGRKRLEAKEKKLLDRNGQKWAEPLGTDLFSWREFRRGFVEYVWIDAQAFLDRGAPLFCISPIRDVRLTDSTGLIPRVTKCPLLMKIGSLELQGDRLNTSDAKALANSPHVEGLIELELDFPSVSIRTLQEFFGQVNRLKSLRGFTADEVGMGSEGLQALASGPLMSQLTSLSAGSNEVDDQGAIAFAESPRVGQLTRLSLNLNPIGSVGIAALANSPHLARLTWLNLSFTSPGAVGHLALARSPHMAHLQYLDLFSTTSEEKDEPKAVRELTARFGDRVQGL